MIRNLLLGKIEITDSHQASTAICGVCVVVMLILVLL